MTANRSGMPRAPSQKDLRTRRALQRIAGGLGVNGPQAANTALMGPVSGDEAIPEFRQIVTADIAALGVSTAANRFLGGPTSGAAAAATFRVFVAADLGSGTASTTTFLRGDLSWQTSVTSVAMTVPSVLSVSGSPITTTGTLAVTLATQTANRFFLGPASGGVATPTFRAVVALDLGTGTADATTFLRGNLAWSVLTTSDLGTGTASATTFLRGSLAWSVLTAADLGTGTADSTTFLRGDLTWATAGAVTSVGLALPASVFTVSGSPVTTAGTLTGTFATQVTKTFFAGPTSGADATPAFRVIATADLGTGTADATTFLRGDGVWSAASGTGGGTVTSVAITVPSILSVSGSPVTTSGTFALTLATQVKNKFFVGPTTGADATPTFRVIDVLDLGTGTASATTFLRGDLTWATPSGGGGSGNVTTDGVFSGRPAAATDGDLFLPSDGFSIERDTGAAWVPWGPIFKLTPSTLSPAWINQGSATETAGADGVFLTTTSGGSGDDVKIRKVSAPSTPYTITAAFIPCMNPTQFTFCGLCWRQSSDGKFVIAGLIYTSAGIDLWVAKYTNATTYSADYARPVVPHLGTMVWIRIGDDGTNRTVKVSADGQNFYQIHTVGRTDFITPDEIGYCVGTNCASGNVSGMNLLSWVQA